MAGLSGSTTTMQCYGLLVVKIFCAIIIPFLNRRLAGGIDHFRSKDLIRIPAQ